MLEELKNIVVDAERVFAEAKDERSLENARIAFLGRKGRLTLATGGLKTLPPEDKPAAGKALNEAKKRLAALFDEAKKRVSESAETADGPVLDVTLPGRRPAIGAKHPITAMIDDCVAIFRRMGFIAADGPEIETVFNNFDALNTPSDHPSRDPRDTFYFSDGRLMRTQTSPVQIRVMKSQQPPVRIVAPGRCFRRDTPDATHSMNFHQIEGLYVDKDVSLADLKSVLMEFAREMFGERVAIRMRPHFFPFTEPSVECDFTCVMCGGKGCSICKNSGWLEIAGAGMVDPAVFEAVGYAPEEWSGFAFGMGIERLAMIKHGVSDIRYFYENDVRFLRQFR
jgi:phenylalanyl-tRNA synthetase alpha chain